MKTDHFDCICDCDEHMITFRYFEKDEISDEPKLYLAVYLNQYRGFFKRIWPAIKYIFGYSSKYGNWDCWTIKPNDTDRLIDILKQYDAKEHCKYCGKEINKNKVKVIIDSLGRYYCNENCFKDHQSSKGF